MVRRFYKEKMKRKKQTKLVQAGQYIAEVEVELIHTDDRWSPYLSLEDAQKLDEVRELLKKCDIKKASSLARVYTLTPVSA